MEAEDVAMQELSPAPANLFGVVVNGERAPVPEKEPLLLQADVTKVGDIVEMFTAVGRSVADDP